jgi:hypothetical protein
MLFEVIMGPTGRNIISYSKRSKVAFRPRLFFSIKYGKNLFKLLDL